MTIYVGNGFSPNMIQDEAQLLIKPVTKNEFLRACKTGKSIIGHPEIAEYFHVPMNRVSLTLLCGDTLYVVSPKQRVNSGEFKHVKEEEGWIYKKISITKVWRKHYD